MPIPAIPDAYTAERRAIVEASRVLVRDGLTAGRSGNVSVRVADGLLVTPTGIAPAALEPAGVVHLDARGERVGDGLMPSSEWRMHRDLYRDRADLAALVHTHPPHATALACLGRPLPAFHYMVAAAGGDSVPLADYATFGTAELSANVCAAMAGRRACLLANHGLLTGGTTLAAALELTIVVEDLCRGYLLALGVGEPVLLPAGEMRRVIEKFADYGRQA